MTNALVKLNILNKLFTLIYLCLGKIKIFILYNFVLDPENDANDA